MMSVIRTEELCQDQERQGGGPGSWPKAEAGPVWDQSQQEGTERGRGRSRRQAELRAAAAAGALGLGAPRWPGHPLSAVQSGLWGSQGRVGALAGSARGDPLRLSGRGTSTPAAPVPLAAARQFPRRPGGGSTGTIAVPPADCGLVQRGRDLWPGCDTGMPAAGRWRDPQQH